MLDLKCCENFSLTDLHLDREIALAEHVAASLAIATGLPASTEYHGDNTHRLREVGLRLGPAICWQTVSASVPFSIWKLTS